MKMFQKYFLIVTVLLLSVTALVACGDTSDPPSTHVDLPEVAINQEEITENETPSTTDAEHEIAETGLIGRWRDNSYPDTLSFAQDRTGVATEIWRGEFHQEDFAWRSSDGRLTMDTSTHGSFIMDYIISIDGDTLTLIIDGHRQTFTRLGGNLAGYWRHESGWIDGLADELAFHQNNDGTMRWFGEGDEVFSFGWEIYQNQLRISLEEWFRDFDYAVSADGSTLTIFDDNDGHQATYTRQ